MYGVMGKDKYFRPFLIRLQTGSYRCRRKKANPSEGEYCNFFQDEFSTISLLVTLIFDNYAGINIIVGSTKIKSKEKLRIIMILKILLI